MAILKNPRLELFAQGLALGKDMYTAAKDAGFNTNIKPESFRQNTRKRAIKPEVKARVRELQERAQLALEKNTTVSIGWIMEKLMEMIGSPLDLADVKPADRLKAMDMVAKIRGMYAPEKREIIARLSELSMDELNRLDEQLSAGIAGDERPNGEELH